MELRELVLKTLVRPVWVAGDPKVETWACPACGRDVERVSPAWKGVWFTAGSDEVTALCARTHRTHDRKGVPVAAGDDAAAEAEDWIPIVAVDGDDRPRSFVALIPPHGTAFVLTPAGDAYEVRRLQELAASDLVGRRAATLPGEVVGTVGTDELQFDGDAAVRLLR